MTPALASRPAGDADRRKGQDDHDETPAITADVDAAGMILAIGDGETILRETTRQISILLAREDVTITHARYSAGERVAGPHVHHQHTDAFYVLDGELTFQIGREAKTVTVSAGGLVAVPPRVAHSLRNDSDRPARWLTAHAHDGGFAAFMRGVRDGVKADWDISQVPADGGLPASQAILSPQAAGDHSPCKVRCALPDLCIAQWHLHRPQTALPLQHRDRRLDTFLVLEGQLEATLARASQTVGPRTLVSVPRGAQHTLNHQGPEPARILSLHTPDTGFADNLRRGSATCHNPCACARARRDGVPLNIQRTQPQGTT